MPVTVTYNGQGLDTLAAMLEKGFEIQSSDILYVLNNEKTRILDRTARGVDLFNRAFAPYSTKGPYYYYPGKSSRTALGRRASASRFARKVGGTRTKVGIKFASYAAFKSSLGRTAVDLLGPSAPHMLQGMVVKTTGPTSGLIGIYGPEADRAEGHNLGTRRLPKREFFGASPDDEVMMMKDLEAIIGARIDSVLGK